MKKRHNNKFPNSLIKVIEKIGNYVYFETEFGSCKKHISCIGIHKFSINDAINKTEYFINKANKVHNFKVYIIKCWGENEEFYKIGRTFLKIEKRFSYFKALPYKYKILKIYEGNVKEIFKLETILKNKNKDNKYIPKLKFHGMYECFNKLKNKNMTELTIEDLLNSLKNPQKVTLENTKETWERIGRKDKFEELGLEPSELDEFLKEFTNNNPYNNLT